MRDGSPCGRKATVSRPARPEAIDARKILYQVEGFQKRRLGAAVTATGHHSARARARKDPWELKLFVGQRWRGLPPGRRVARPLPPPAPALESAARPARRYLFGRAGAGAGGRGRRGAG